MSICDLSWHLAKRGRESNEKVDICTFGQKKSMFPKIKHVPVQSRMENHWSYLAFGQLWWRAVLGKVSPRLREQQLVSCRQLLSWLLPGRWRLWSLIWFAAAEVVAESWYGSSKHLLDGVGLLLAAVFKFLPLFIAVLLCDSMLIQSLAAKEFVDT